MQGSNPPSAGSAGRPDTALPGWVVERPPPGLARGKVAVSPWLIGALGAVAVLLTAAFYFRVLRARRRKAPS